MKKRSLVKLPPIAMSKLMITPPQRSLNIAGATEQAALICGRGDTAWVQASEPKGGRKPTVVYRCAL